MFGLNLTLFLPFVLFVLLAISTWRLTVGQGLAKQGLILAGVLSLFGAFYSMLGFQIEAAAGFLQAAALAFGLYVVAEQLNDK